MSTTKHGSVDDAWHAEPASKELYTSAVSRSGSSQEEFMRDALGLDAKRSHISRVVPRVHAMVYGNPGHGGVMAIV